MWSDIDLLREFIGLLTHVADFIFNVGQKTGLFIESL